LERYLVWFSAGVPTIVTEDFLGLFKFLPKYREVSYFSLRSALRSSLRNHCVVPYTSPKNEPWTVCAVNRTPYITSYFCYTGTCFDISVVNELRNKYYIVKSVPALQLQVTVSYNLFYIRSGNLLIFLSCTFLNSCELWTIYRFVLFYLVKQSFKCEVLLYKTFLTNIKGLNPQVCILYIQSQLIQFLKFRIAKNSYFMYYKVKYVWRNSNWSLGVKLFFMCVSYILLHKHTGITSTSVT
jgi:hypothetical protein